MLDLKEIKAEIRKVVTDTVEAGAIGHVQFFTAQIMSSHDRIEGDDADFYLICAREVVKSEVKRAIGRYETPETDAPLMEGFEHLRTAYPVHRDGDHLLVPVHLCTDDELEARALEFLTAAKGYQKHAKEIRAYILARHEKKSEQPLLSAV